MPWFARNAFTVRMRNARGWLATLLICGPSTGPRIFDMEPPRRARATVERRACDDEPMFRATGRQAAKQLARPKRGLSRAMRLRAACGGLLRGFFERDVEQRINVVRGQIGRVDAAQAADERKRFGGSG